MRWSRLFCITLTLVSLAKSYASLISCIGFLHPVGLSDFSMAPVPAQQEDSEEDMMQTGEGRKECPKLEEIGALAKGG